MFKKKEEESKEIRVACDTCGRVLDRGLERCPNCAQKIVAAPAGDSDSTTRTNQLDSASSSVSDNSSKKKLSDEAKSDTPASDYFPELASVWRRIMAAFMDHALLTFLSLFFLLLLFIPPMGYIMSPAACTERLNIFPAILNIPSAWIGTILFPGSIAIVLALPLLYFAFLESSSWQATLGKRIFGLKVVGLKSNRIHFGQGICKVLIQGIILFLVAQITSISVQILAMQFPLGQLEGYALVGIEAISIAALFCLPLFRSGTQSLLDRLTGRILVNNDSFDESSWETRVKAENKDTKSAGKTESSRKWKAFRDFLLVVSFLILVPELALAGTYDWIFLKSASSAAPLIEKAAELDPDLQSPNSRAYVKQARKICPDIEVAYTLFSGTARALGRTAESELLTRQAQLIGPDASYAFMARAKLFEGENKFDKAEYNYERALLTLPPAKRNVKSAGLSISESDNLFVIDTKLSQLMMKQGRERDANRTLTELIDNYPQGNPGEIFFATKKSELYGLRAESWRALKKPELAALDEKHAGELKLKEENEK